MTGSLILIRFYIDRTIHTDASSRSPYLFFGSRLTRLCFKRDKTQRFHALHSYTFDGLPLGSQVASNTFSSHHELTKFKRTDLILSAGMSVFLP